jgi:FG-GAP-like repeat
VFRGQNADGSLDRRASTHVPPVTFWLALLSIADTLVQRWCRPSWRMLVRGCFIPRTKEAASVQQADAKSLRASRGLLGGGSTARVHAQAWMAVWACLSGCAELPALPSNECGNGVVEANEDCDTFAPVAGSVCRPKDSTDPCRFDCQPGPDGMRPTCPAGWGCDPSGLCRAPTGQFTNAGSFVVGPVAELLAGDFDGDGRSDVLSREPTNTLDRSRLALHYFNTRGELQETRVFPKLVAAPQLHDLSGDQRVDLAFSDYGVGLMLGRADRGLVNETFTSYRLPDTRVRLVGAHDGPIRGAASLVTFAALDGQPSFAVADSATGRLRPLGALPGPIDDAVGDPVTGDIISGVRSPCDEVVLAMRGAASFMLIDVCDLDLVVGDAIWRERAELQSIALPEGVEIDAPPQVLDMNGDGHLDVLLGASGRAYAAYGDGKGLAAAVPYSFTLWFDRKTSETITDMPLAAGDFTGDGLVDFVGPLWLIASVPRFDGGPARYEPAEQNLGEPWTRAYVADLNADGKMDVAAASDQGLGIALFHGTGTRYLTQSSLPTRAPVPFLAVGDFDGDLTNDLAFVERATTREARDSLAIAFGNVGRPASTPQIVARVQNPEQLSVYGEHGRGSLLVASRQTEPQDFGAVTLLAGNADRLLFAPHTLVSFSDDGSLMDFPALGLLSGSFRGGRHRDVLALGGEADRSFKFWIIEDLELGQSTPVRLLQDAVDSSFRPVVGDRVRVASAAADLNDDGRDEALWAMPTESGGCGLLSFDVDLVDGSPALTQYGALQLDEPCEEPQVATFDADSDGSPDILLLSSNSDGEQRKLLVLWNDGHGGFTEHPVQLSESRHAPRAFATLPPSTVRGASIVYIAEDEALLVSAHGDGRGFGPARSLTDLEQGSGVVSADINGDSALDLVIADNGKLTVLLGELKTP